VKTLLLLAGIGQLVLTAASLALPRILDWREETRRLGRLTRQVFWTYAAYIWVTNLCFGLLSAFAPGWLVGGSPLARAVAGFITAWWGARVLVQFFYFDRSAAPPGALYDWAHRALAALFVFLTAVYAYAAVGS
jgi:hypothetical protein